MCLRLPLQRGASHHLCPGCCTLHGWPGPHFPAESHPGWQSLQAWFPSTIVTTLHTSPKCARLCSIRWKHLPGGSSMPFLLFTNRRIPGPLPGVSLQCSVLSLSLLALFQLTRVWRKSGMDPRSLFSPPELCQRLPGCCGDQTALSLPHSERKVWARSPSPPGCGRAHTGPFLRRHEGPGVRGSGRDWQPTYWRQSHLLELCPVPLSSAGESVFTKVVTLCVL